VPIVRIDPPPRRGSGGFFAGLKRLGAFAAAPIPTLIQSVQDIHAPKERGRFLPTEFDTDTGEVRIELPKKARGVIGRTLLNRGGEALSANAAFLEQELERSIRTGSVVPTLPGAYRELASLLLEQAAIFPMATEPQGQYDMPGVIPPGGFAGFAQMTPASRLALGGGKAAKRRTKKKAQRTRNKAKKARKVARNAKRRTKRAGKKKLVKGSPAARAFMARLRAKRK